ncbi:MAG: DNA polymerase III subunit delta [Aureispira sp.]|nr:DNA polymerase III subunit delta [Aureispira sp.]
MTYNQIVSAIKKKSYFPVYFLHGNEAYFIDQIVKCIEDSVLTESEKAFNQTILYGKEIDHKAVLDNARRYPVMAERQVVIVKEAQELKHIDKLSAYFEKPLDSTILVFAHKHKRLDKRKAFVKILSKSDKVCFFESTKLYDSKVPKWIEGYLKEKKIAIKASAVRLLAEYLGTDLSKIVNELDKLTINLKEGEQIDKNLIQKNIGISKDFNIFELQTALGNRDTFKVQMIINYFIANAKNHPLPMITSALHNYFSKLYMYKFLTGVSESEAAREMGVNSYFLKDYKRAAQTYSKQQLENVFTVLKEYDLRSKGVHNSSLPHSALLQEMLYKIMHLPTN